jgi:hypothetical protein
VVVAFHAPAYSDSDKDKAALDLLGPLAFGTTSELYNKLVRVEQKVDTLFQSFGNSIDPGLFQVSAEVKDPKDLEYVREQIRATFRRFTDETVSQVRLDESRSRRRYALALQMNSSAGIANALVPYIALRRTPETLNRLFSLYQQITPEDLRVTRRRRRLNTDRMHGNRRSGDARTHAGRSPDAGRQPVGFTDTDGASSQRVASRDISNSFCHWRGLRSARQGGSGSADVCDARPGRNGDDEQHRGSGRPVSDGFIDHGPGG